MSATSSSRFTVIEQIGGGNYGTLFRVIDSEAPDLADRIIATKKLKDPINHPHVLREVSVQRQAQACTRHVVHLLHVVPRDQVRAALVLEYVPLDLRAFLNALYCERTPSKLGTPPGTEERSHSHSGSGGTTASSPLLPTHTPLSYIKRILRGLLQALVCLHARGVAHRDVKPENILVEPLGLDHPLRCVCPPGDKPCWVHTPHRGTCNATDGTSSPTQQGNETLNHACTSRLEPCRSFLHGAAVLHHELSGDALAKTLHLLHCEQCAREAPLAVTREEDNHRHPATLQIATEERVHSAAGGGHHAHSHQLRTKPEEPEALNEAQRKGSDSSFSSKSLQDAASDPRSVATDSHAGHGSSASPTRSAPLTPDVKLCDFGSARPIGTLRLRSTEEQREELTPGPTTPVYCAPEMMLRQRYGTAVDVWAVGVIFYEMLTGNFFLSVGTLRSFHGDLVVHEDYCVMHRLQCMFQQLGTPTPKEWCAIAHQDYYPVKMLSELPQRRTSAIFSMWATEGMQNVSSGDSSSTGGADGDGTAVERENEEGATKGDVERAMDTQEGGRASMTDAAGHPTVSEFLLRHVGESGMHLLWSLLRYDPADRITAAAALRHPFLQED